MATVLVAALGIVAVMVSVASGVSGLADSLKPKKQPIPVYVVAPIDGIFWRGAYQGAKPFVEVGSEVEPSTVVAQVEQMKAFKLTAGYHGTIVEILVADGQWVAAWQPLMKIIPKPVEAVPMSK